MPDTSYFTVPHLDRKAITRLFAKIQVGAAYQDKGFCWEWIAHRNPVSGYGMFHWKGLPAYAHRIMFAWLVGPIPKGNGIDQIDHLCRNRACVNPAHLELVSPRINCIRGVSPAAINARKTHCPKGHKYEHAGDGDRHCKACNNERQRVRRATDPDWAARTREKKRVNRLKLREDPAYAEQERLKHRAYRQNNPEAYEREKAKRRIRDAERRRTDPVWAEKKRQSCRKSRQRKLQ